MTANIGKRLARLEADHSKPLTHEEALFALLRQENPPPSYTAEQRAADVEILERDQAALLAAGLN
ncbi:MAG: hypothetical protein H7Y60_12850 [Rhodospirillaceae bacterium]|nr:hypothetical protein [Rhodospirillales bacterium]